MPNFSRFLSALIVAFGLLCSAASLRAHEVQPGIADVTVMADSVQVDLSLNIEVFLAGIDASRTEDTNAAPEAAAYDALRALEIPALREKLSAAEADFLAMLELTSGEDRLTPVIDAVSVEGNVPLTLPRLTTIRLTAPLPEGNAGVTIRMAETMGPLAVRQQAEEIDPKALYTAYVPAGQVSEEIPREGGVNRPALVIFGEYILIGIDHIIPKGLDHIVFIMGLFFFSPKWRPLLGQVTVFTLAHSVTLVLATLGVVAVPASIVEPLIALSIAWIGIENILRPGKATTRLGVIFVFGLLHGLGFAFVLGEVGLVGTAYALSLIAFNIGVEIGQLLVLAPLLVMAYFIARREWYRDKVEIPASILIALIGAYWFIERVIL